MKKSKNIISDWLDKYGDPEIDKKVEEELERMTNKEESKQDFTEEYEKQLNISDVSHSLHGKLNIGDTIKWNGEYFDGYDENRNMKNKHQEGINKIDSFLLQRGILYMRLDNRKLFIIKDIDTGEEVNDGWEKL